MRRITSRVRSYSPVYCHSILIQVDGQDVETSAEAGGYYRLAFGGEQTNCIGYHASEDTVQASREEGVHGFTEDNACLRSLRGVHVGKSSLYSDSNMVYFLLIRNGRVFYLSLCSTCLKFN